MNDRQPNSLLRLYLNPGKQHNHYPFHGTLHNILVRKELGHYGAARRFVNRHC